MLLVSSHPVQSPSVVNNRGGVLSWVGVVDSLNIQVVLAYQAFGVGVYGNLRLGLGGPSGSLVGGAGLTGSRSLTGSLSRRLSAALRLGASLALGAGLALAGRVTACVTIGNQDP